MLKKKLFDIKNLEGRNKIGQIAFTFQIWIDLLTNKLEMEDVPKVEVFCDHVFTR